MALLLSRSHLGGMLVYNRNRSAAKRVLDFIIQNFLDMRCRVAIHLKQAMYSAFFKLGKPLFFVVAETLRFFQLTPSEGPVFGIGVIE